MNATTASIVVAGLLIFGAFFLTTANKNPGAAAAPTNNIAIENGTQIITIKAKGGYSPRSMTAKAGLPTELRVDTNNTYDCSSALNIPSIGYRNYLPATGSTTIPLPPQKAGSTLRGICAMGMYNFTISFE